VKDSPFNLKKPFIFHPDLHSPLDKLTEDIHIAQAVHRNGGQLAICLLLLLLVAWLLDELVGCDRVGIKLVRSQQRDADRGDQRLEEGRRIESRKWKVLLGRTDK